MNHSRCSAFFLILFLCLFLLPAGFTAVSVFLKNVPQDGNMLAQGDWTKKYEKIFNEQFLLYRSAVEQWGRAEYAIFGTGKKDVVVGNDGWLFSAEEYECERNYKDIFQHNLNRITNVKNQLALQKTSLIVVLVPSKARLYQPHSHYSLPSCKTFQYGKIQSYLEKQNIDLVDLYKGFSSKQNNTWFLKTDTHWSAAGAREAARLVSLNASLKFLKKDNIYINHKVDHQNHEGDLTKFLTGFDAETLLEIIPLYKTSSKSESDDLFSEAMPATILVGTSYSANKIFNFEGFLKQYLSRDVLNMSKERIGPFQAMERYLESDTFKTYWPEVVIWEIPERYFSLPDKP